MKTKRLFIFAFILLSAGILIFAQRPPKGFEWFDRFDINKNGRIEAEEYQTAADSFFKQLDRNNDLVIDDAERPRRQPPPNGVGQEQFPMPGVNRPTPMPGNPPPFPFFVMESIRQRGDINHAKFQESINEQFSLMDQNGDRAVSREEARVRFEEIDRRVKSEAKPGVPQPFDSPTARFIGAQMRFGDKFVKDAPFSAEIVIENTRRLFDGSTVTKQSTGAIFRDGAGRTRREQPLEVINGFPVLGENNQPQKLIFINDFAAKTHYFIDPNRKIARVNPLPEDRPPLPEIEPKDGQTESLGTKMLEGVRVEGTRAIVQIPVGQIGNEKPLQIITEKWFSPELQVVVMSRHIDPVAGEHIFRLVNIKRAEPSADLFTVPGGFKIENPPKPGNKRNE